MGETYIEKFQPYPRELNSVFAIDSGHQIQNCTVTRVPDLFGLFFAWGRCNMHWLCICFWFQLEQPVKFSPVQIRRQGLSTASSILPLHGTCSLLSLKTAIGSVYWEHPLYLSSKHGYFNAHSCSMRVKPAGKKAVLMTKDGISRSNSTVTKLCFWFRNLFW